VKNFSAGVIVEVELGNAFVLAAQAGMEMTGKTVEHRDGKLVAAD